MMFASFPLFADGAARTVMDWGRIESNADLVLPLLVVAVLVIFARYMIRRDSRELPALAGWLLTALRVGAILCLLVIYLDPQWRSEREVVRNSRALLLVDTSLSMGLSDALAPSASLSGASRAGQVAQALAENEFLARLRKTHDVVVLRFDENVRRVVSLDKISPGGGSEGTSEGGSPILAAQRSGQSPGRQDALDERIDWQAALAPNGVETRLGQALRELIQAERGSPLAGIVVFSDGGQNAGVSPEAAIEAARTARIPVFTVGLGSESRAVNVRVSNLEVPPQAHPGDPYQVTGLVQSHGLAGQEVAVELLMRKAEEGETTPVPGSGIPVRREQIVLGGDGEAVPVKFDLTPAETGRHTICLRVRAPEADADPGDNFLEEEIDFVDRKIRVLLFAGGPTREYRFLRTQLHRDAAVTVDVLLQTAQPGISQEADRILDGFPATRDQMYAYDCVIALDPDWGELAPTQVDLLEGWVAEQGGGMIVVPGPVHAGESIVGWVQDPNMAKIRALYPVEFQRRLTVFEGGTHESPEPWPLDFTREGLEAAFLWLDDSAPASQRVWAEFPGVYCWFPVQGPKPGAAVLARLIDSGAGRSDDEPVYFAEQFYGSGRAFYLGSGEMWRLRSVEVACFERFYTRLVRHVSQGRVLRQSSRGALMVDRDRYMLGDTVQIRARLTDAQLEPFEAPQVALNVNLPHGKVQTVTLRSEPGRPGMFAGQLTVVGEGTYRLELPVPESDDERLTRRVRVSLPDLERQNPQRNDKLLARLAQATGGEYYDDLAAALAAGPDPLVERLKDRTKTIIQTGALEPPSLRWLLRARLPDHLWQARWFAWLADESWLRVLLDQTLLWWLMTVLCGLLCCEWLIRRLARLA